MCRAASSTLFVQSVSFRWPAFRAKSMHSFTRSFPTPWPRPVVSTSSSRSFPIALVSLTRKTDPTRSPSTSAIQRSRSGGAATRQLLVP